MNRADIPGGPAFITFDSVTYQAAEENFTVENSVEEIEISTNLQGLVNLKEGNVMSLIKLTPVGIWGNLAKMFPYQPGNRGNLIFTNTDKPVVIQTKSGFSLTFSAGAITKSPAIRFAAGKPLFDSQLEILCLRKNATAATATDAHIAVASSAYTEPTLDIEAIILDQYTTTWGDSSPWTDIEMTEDGVLFTPNYEFDDVGTDRAGKLNARIKAVSAEVNFTPVNISETNLYAKLMQLDGAGMGRGKSVPRDEFTVTGSAEGSPILTIPALARANKGALNFGGAYRSGAVTLRAIRTDISGVLQALFTLGTVEA